MSALPIISDVVVDFPSVIEVKRVEIPKHGPAESWTRDEQWKFIQSYNAVNSSLVDFKQALGEIFILMGKLKKIICENEPGGELAEHQELFYISRN